MSDVISREVFERGQAGAVLLYDPQRDEVILIRQFRAGAYVAGHHPWIWEAVAGIIEENETAEVHGPPRGGRGSRPRRSASCCRSTTVMLTPGACSEAC